MTGIASEVMQVAEDFLVGADQEYSEAGNGSPLNSVQHEWSFFTSRRSMN